MQYFLCFFSKTPLFPPVYINLLDGRADGVIKEVTDNGIVLENKNGVQVVNLDYVVKLREHPYNKKGKRSTIMDM